MVQGEYGHIVSKVGRSPRTAADAFVGPLCVRSPPDQGVPRGRGRPPHKVKLGPGHRSVPGAHLGFAHLFLTEPVRRNGLGFGVESDAIFTHHV